MVKHFCIAATLVIISVTSSQATAQGLAKRWGFGGALGIQQLYSDWAQTPLGFGGHGLATYRLSDRGSIGLHLGYNTLRYVRTDLPNSPTHTTNLYYADLVFDYELASQQSKVRPFLMGGIGGINFLFVDQNRRFNDGALLLGGGFRAFVNPTLALNFSGDFKLTTGDDLDSRKDMGDNNINDAYFSFRAGLTYYLAPKPATIGREEILTQRRGGDDIFLDFEPDSNTQGGEGPEYDDFVARLNALESGDTSSLTQSGRKDVRQVNMQEYLRLKSKIDELNSKIENKESQISNLREDLGEKNGSSPPPPGASTSYRPSGPIEISSFSGAYETALNKYYRRRYSEAIQIFEKMLENYPNHSLASNCEYWIGESYFGLGEYNMAIASFDRVLQYPISLKKDDALLMMGRAYLQLNLRAKAEETFNKLIREYPDSEFVIKSEQYLRKL